MQESNSSPSESKPCALTSELMSLMAYSCGVLIYIHLQLKIRSLCGKQTIEVIHFTHAWQYIYISFQLYLPFNTLPPIQASRFTK